MQADELVEEEQKAEFSLARIERSAEALLERALHPAGEAVSRQNSAQLLVDFGRRGGVSEEAARGGEKKRREKQTAVGNDSSGHRFIGIDRPGMSGRFSGMVKEKVSELLRCGAVLETYRVCGKLGA